jgi:Ca2+-transporting ATPase
MLSQLKEPLQADMPGLSSEEAGQRLKDAGPNRIIKIYDVSLPGIFLEEITEPMMLLLLVVGVLYSIWGKLEDTLTIIAIIILLVSVEVWNEYRAKKSIASLSKVSAPQAKVLRDG